MRSLIAAIRFLTRLPMPGLATTASDLPGAIAWFPLVGAGVGLVVGGVAVALVPLWNIPIAVVLAIAVGLLLTGGFHEDAASDAADGLGGGFTNERVLEIMRDSRIGAYGAMSLWLVLTLRFALLTLALERLPGWQVPIVYGLACAWGRWTAAPLLAVLPPLADGLAKDIQQQQSRWPLVIACLQMLAIQAAALAIALPGGWWVPPIALLTCGVWALYLWQRLKGQSGDLLGAGNLVVENAVFLAILSS